MIGEDFLHHKQRKNFPKLRTGSVFTPYSLYIVVRAFFLGFENKRANWGVSQLLVYQAQIDSYQELSTLTVVAARLWYLKLTQRLIVLKCFQMMWYVIIGHHQHAMDIHDLCFTLLFLLAVAKKSAINLYLCVTDHILLEILGNHEYQIIPWSLMTLCRNVFCHVNAFFHIFLSCEASPWPLKLSRHCPWKPLW